MGVFDRQIATAQRLIRRNGRLVYFRVSTPGAPIDPNKPWILGDPTSVIHSVPMVLLPRDIRTERFMAALAGTDTVTGSDYGLMGAVPFTVEPNQHIYSDQAATNVLRTIRNFDLLAPNGDPILYTIQFEVA